MSDIKEYQREATEKYFKDNPEAFEELKSQAERPIFCGHGLMTCSECALKKYLQRQVESQQKEIAYLKQQIKNAEEDIRELHRYGGDYNG